MTIPKLMLDIDSSSYTATFGNEILSVKVQNGPSRRRRDFIGAPSVVAAQWVLDDIEYQYLMAFYRSTITMGTLPFLLDMIIDYADVGEFQCVIVEGSFSLSAKQGNAYIVQAQLEVSPVPADGDYDTTLVMLFEEYGSGAAEMLDLFATFANVTLPENLDQ